MGEIGKRLHGQLVYRYHARGRSAFFFKYVFKIHLIIYSLILGKRDGRDFTKGTVFA